MLAVLFSVKGNSQRGNWLYGPLKMALFLGKTSHMNFILMYTYFC
jgi:hypothetical protein